MRTHWFFLFPSKKTPIARIDIRFAPPS